MVKFIQFKSGRTLTIETETSATHNNLLVMTTTKGEVIAVNIAEVEYYTTK